MVLFSNKNLDKTDGPSSSKKMKLNDTDPAKERQNKLLFKYRDYLKTLTLNKCKELLEYNNQEIPTSGMVCY